MARSGDITPGKPGPATPGTPKPAHVPVTAAKLARGGSIGHIKVHGSGPKPALGAQAFTRGSEPAFKAPAHQPILGHEVAHVIQQKHGRVPKPPA